ncbi:MAG: peptidylprolyl isomerase [Treponemataceae bacterium]|nr:MAG: peptidylprolyl isomerase [Treponemataceae bacterium]
MTITKDKVVAIDYCLKNSAGDVLDFSDSAKPLEYLHGYHNVIPGLEKSLEGKHESDTFETVIEPDEGYGEYADELVMEVSREIFPAGVDIAVGARFQADSASGPVMVTVSRIAGESITVDANHPFAGERLFFSVKVISVRDASQAEIDHGLSRCGGGCAVCCGCY